MSDSPYATYLGFLRCGELAYQWSESAGKCVFFPRAVSPHDEREQLQWKVSSGLGTVYSTTVVRGKTDSYNVALIDCDEGFRLMSRVEGCQPGQVHIGQRVKLAPVLPEDDGEPYPVFVPLEAA